MRFQKYFYFRVHDKKTSIEIEDASDADVVEVVRCADCIWYKEIRLEYGTVNKTYKDIWYCTCDCSMGGQGQKKPDDYCSRAVLKEGREE